MRNSTTEEVIRKKFESIGPVMSELLRRRWAATEALAIGRGGVSLVSRATRMSRSTILKGIEELTGSGGSVVVPLKKGYARHTGGGRKKIVDIDEELSRDLQLLVDPVTRGDPESPLMWTCKSTRKLAEELKLKGHRVGERTVAHLLKQKGFSMQSNRKTKEGNSHPDRNAQFEYISKKVKEFQEKAQPVISVDTKKKELIGDFKNNGKEWQLKGCPEKVNVHDFADSELGKGIPYGVYDMTSNNGWVSVGVDHDTAKFAASTIQRWWERMGIKEYPDAKELLITADGGGSNSSRSRLWKVSLQVLANTTGLRISICHFPPGTSKWNKIEHSMFSHISENWRGRPLRSLGIIVNLIANTRTRSGLHIDAEIDTNKYETGIKITDEQLGQVSLVKSDFHGEWNYTISPKK